MILLILGFGIRLAYGAARYRGELMHLSGTNFIRSWEHDGLEHVLIAKALLDGRGYVVESIPLPPGKKVRFPDQDAMFKAPMYEFFLAGVFAISGFSFKLFFPLQALFGGLASGLLGLIAWETFKRPWAAWIAGFFAATHPILVNAATVPYNEDLFFSCFWAHSGPSCCGFEPGTLSGHCYAGYSLACARSPGKAEYLCWPRWEQ